MKRIWMVGTLLVSLMLCGCGEGAVEEHVLDQYTRMTGATMEAQVTSSGDFLISEFTLRCDYQVEGETVVEVLSPETMAGVKGKLWAGEWVLEYEDTIFNVGTLSSQAISPLACMPLLMEGLSKGWVLEENTQTYQEKECYCVTLDYSDETISDLTVTAWLDVADGTPVGAEVVVDGERILQVVFTSFTFYDTIEAE